MMPRTRVNARHSGTPNQRSTRCSALAFMKFLVVPLSSFRASELPVTRTMRSSELERYRLAQARQPVFCAAWIGLSPLRGDVVDDFIALGGIADRIHVGGRELRFQNRDVFLEKHEC